MYFSEAQDATLRGVAALTDRNGALAKLEFKIHDIKQK